MGNSESATRKFKDEELTRTAKTDGEILTSTTDISFDDSLIVQQYLSELESNTRQYQVEDEKLSKIRKFKEKWRNTELALSILDPSKTNYFQKKELKWLRKEIQSLGGLGIGSFEHVLSIRLKGIEKIHTAILRTNERLKKKGLYSALSKDAEIQRKADFIMNLFVENQDANNGKLMDHILSRLSELPHILDLTYGTDLEEKEKEENPAMEIESGTKTSAPQDFSTLDVETLRSLEEQFAKNLTAMIINVVAEDTKTLLSKLNSDSPSPDQSTVSATPAMKLLQRIQRDMLHKAASVIEISNSEPITSLLFYTILMLKSAIDILNLAIKANGQLIQEKDKRLDIRIQSVLRNSFIYHLIFPFCTVLCKLLERKHFTRFAVEVLPSMVILMSLIDTLNNSHSESQFAEKHYLERLKQSESSTTVEVESPHNYYPNTDEEKVVHIPGATHLSVTFDPRCNSELSHDFLQLYKFPGKLEPILDAFSGKSENWPKVPVIVNNDTVCFHFTSEPYMTHWGYRCIVTPLMLESSKVWLYELERTLGFAISNCIDQSILYPNFPGSKLQLKEDSHQIWLDSQLFRGGIQNESLETERKFIDEFIYNKEGSFAAKMVSKIESKVQPNPTVDRMCGPVINPALRAYIVAMMKHLGILSSILETLTSDSNSEFQMSAEIEEILIKLWLEARKLRQWIANERRRLLLEFEAKNEEKQSDSNANENPSVDNKEKDSKMEVEKKEPQEEQFSYEFFNKDVISKMKFLLSLNPACNYHVMEDLGFDILDESSKKRKRANSPGIKKDLDESPLKTWKDLFNSWQAVQSLSKSQQISKPGRKSPQEMFSSIPNLVADFTKSADSETIQSLMNARAQRAKYRSI